jgi:membrane protease YdiL (CAAX protease family)
MPSLLQNIVIGFEYALALAGLVYLGWLWFSSEGHAVRARPAALPAWDVSPTDFLFLGWLIFSIGILGQLLIRFTVTPLLKDHPEGSSLELLVSGSMFHFAAVGTWLAARAWVRRHRPGDLQACPPKTSAQWQLSLHGGFLAFLAVMPLATGAGLAWERLLETMGLPTERQELVDLILQSESPSLLSFVILLALVVAPVAEELVFRIGIFRYLRSRGPRWAAYGVSAGLFALLHFNWMSALPLFILGLVFAVSYERTGRMAVPMIAHALFNLNTLLLVLSGAGN